MPDVVLLDLDLPDADGADVIKSLRERWSHRPILVVSARDREDDELKACDRGADDYITKPFSTGELVARIRVALRHEVMARGGGARPVLAQLRRKLEADLARPRYLVTEPGIGYRLKDFA